MIYIVALERIKLCIGCQKAKPLVKLKVESLWAFSVVFSLPLLFIILERRFLLLCFNIVKYKDFRL